MFVWSRDIRSRDIETGKQNMDNKFDDSVDAGFRHLGLLGPESTE